MDNLPFLIGPVGCAVMMAVMMAVMARVTRRDGEAARNDPAGTAEVSALRAEIDQLRAERAERPTPVDG